jgi:hypothetical protein
LHQAHETDDEQVLYAELLQIAAENLERFTTVDDTTGRVLGGGVNVRYEGRLCNVQQTVAAVSGDEDSPQMRLLAAAGIKLEDMKEACDDLVARSEKFAELDVAQREAAAAENQVCLSRVLKLISVAARLACGHTRTLKCSPPA